MVNSKLVKSSVWYTISNILVKGLSFISIPIFTRLMTKEEFGLFNNFNSWLSIFMIIGTLSLSSSLLSARFDFKDKFDSYILSIITLGSMISLALYIIIRLNINYFENILSIDRSYINFMFMYIIVSQPIDIFQSVQRFKYKYKVSVLVSVLASLVTIALSLYLVILFEDKFSGRVFGNYIPVIGINLSLYVMYLIKGKKIEVRFWKYALKICIPYVPHLLSLTILSASDRIMITNLAGASDTALYSIAYSIASIVTLFWSSINTAFSPWLGEKIHKNNIKSVYDISTAYVMIVAIFVIGIMFVAPEILMFMGGENYISAVYVIPPVMLGCLFQYIYTMYVNIEQFAKKTVGMAFASILAAIINILLNWIFIPKFGFIAAAYTTLISYGFLLLFHYIIVKRIGLSMYYNTRNIILIVFWGLIMTVIVNILYSHHLIRYGISVAYFIGIFVLLQNKYQKYLKDFRR